MPDEPNPKKPERTKVDKTLTLPQDLVDRVLEGRLSTDDAERLRYFPEDLRARFLGGGVSLAQAEAEYRHRLRYLPEDVRNRLVACKLSLEGAKSEAERVRTIEQGPPTQMSVSSFETLLLGNALKFFAERPPADHTEEKLREFLREFPEEHVERLLTRPHIQSKFTAVPASAPFIPPSPAEAPPRPFIPSDWLTRHHPKIVDRIKGFLQLHSRLTRQLEGERPEQARLELSQNIGE